jgi:hypothetical protein
MNVGVGDALPMIPDPGGFGVPTELGSRVSPEFSD